MRSEKKIKGLLTKAGVCLTGSFIRPEKMMVEIKSAQRCR